MAKPQVRSRFDEEAIKRMAESMGEVGILQPILVREDGERYWIIDGEMRWRAARLLGLESVPVIIESKPLDAGAVLQRQLVANVQRCDLSALEKAEALRQLLAATEWTTTQAAAKLGLSTATVTKHLALLTLPESVREQLVTGKLVASAAYELAQIADPVRQVELAERLTSGRLTRDGLASLRKREQTTQTESAGPVTRATVPLGDGRSVTVTDKRPTLDSFIRALEEVLARARKERPRGVELATFLKLARDTARNKVSGGKDAS